MEEETKYESEKKRNIHRNGRKSVGKEEEG
jgi:hypothetical protein